MSLDDLGNLGEFVSALAVVVSVLYLAIQIRQNTRSLRAQAHQSITTHIGELNRTIVEHEDVAEILERGLEDPTVLTPDEARRFNAYNSARFRHYDNLYYQYRVGVLEPSQWEGFSRMLRYHFMQAGLRRWWNDSTAFYSPEFVAYCAELQRDAGALEELDELDLDRSSDLW